VTPESLKADNYRRKESLDARCAMCEHFLDGGPYARRCRIHTYSAHEIMHAVTRNGVCDKFSSRNALAYIVAEMRRIGKMMIEEDGPFSTFNTGTILCQYADRIEQSPDNPEGK
jgi:ribosomal protein L34E